MIPSYHDAVTAAIFAIIAALCCGYAVAQDQKHEDGVFPSTLAFINGFIALIYLLVWATPR